MGVMWTSIYLLVAVRTDLPVIHVWVCYENYPWIYIIFLQANYKDKETGKV